MSHSNQLGTDPLFKLIMRFSIPSIIAMFVNALYNIVDRAFIGQYVGESALAALTIAFPLMMFVFSVGALFGIGSAALISIKLGESKPDVAQNIFGNVISIVIVSSVLIVGVVMIFLNPLLIFLGATESVLPFAYQYMSITLFGTIFSLSSFVLAALARAEGAPRLSMFSQIMAAVVNIILDYLFIVTLNWGVTGAAIATIISQFTGFAILAYYFFFSGDSLLRIHKKYLKLDFALVKQMTFIGFPNFIMTIGGSIVATFSLITLSNYGDDGSVAIMGVINALYTLLLMPVLGLQQGVGPIMGYNHGMKQPERVHKALYISILIGCAYSITLTTIMRIWPIYFAELFLDADSDTMDMCVHAMNIFFIMLTILPINIFGVGYFQSTAQNKKSFILSISRQGLFIIPALIILPKYYGLDGVWLATPVSDFISISLTTIFLAVEFIKFKKQQKKSTAL